MTLFLGESLSWTHTQHLNFGHILT